MAAGVIPSTKSALEAARLGKYPGEAQRIAGLKSYYYAKFPNSTALGRRPRRIARLRNLWRIYNIKEEWKEREVWC